MSEPSRETGVTLSGATFDELTANVATLIRERDEARAQCATLQAERNAREAQITSLVLEGEELRATLARRTEALKYFADCDNPETAGIQDHEAVQVLMHRCRLARRALDDGTA